MNEYSSKLNQDYYENDKHIGGKFLRHAYGEYGFEGSNIWNITRYISYWEYQLGIVAEWVNKNKGDVLDLACGDAPILDRIEGINSYTGVDISPTRIEIDKKQYPNSTYHFLIDDILIPKESYGTYDTVLLNEIIEHVPDASFLLKCAKDHLKKGGLVIVSTPLESRYLEGIGKIYEDNHIRVFSAHYLKKLMIEGGFEIVKIYIGGFQLNYTITMKPQNILLKGYKLLSRKKNEREMDFEMKKLRIGLLDSRVLQKLYQRKVLSKNLIKNIFSFFELLSNQAPVFGDQIILIAKKK